MRHPVAVLILTVLVLSACGRSGSAPADPADSIAPCPQTISLDVAGREIRIPIPTGMGRSDELDVMFPESSQSLPADLRMMFWGDSAIADFKAIREGRWPAGRARPLPFPMAGVAVFTGDMASAAEWMQSMRREQRNPERFLLRQSSSKALRSSVRGLLAKDPEGGADLPLPLGDGQSVGLEMVYVGDRASLRLWAYRLSFQTAEGLLSVAVMAGVADVVVRDRVIAMLLQTNDRPTTGGAARLRRALRDWVVAALSANEEPQGPAPSGRSAEPPNTEDLPAFGEYVYVDELPEAVKTVAPEYPHEARAAGVSGTVMVQALVGKDGMVKDARVVESVPMLDVAAVAAVQKWVFKPARVKNKPVAVWVVMPVKFSLRSAAVPRR